MSFCTGPTIKVSGVRNSCEILVKKFCFSWESSIVLATSIFWMAYVNIYFTILEGLCVFGIDVAECSHFMFSMNNSWPFWMGSYDSAHYTGVPWSFGLSLTSNVWSLETIFKLKLTCSINVENYKNCNRDCVGQKKPIAKLAMEHKKASLN